MRPRLTLGTWTTSAILLALSGVSLILVGAYFLLLRPPLLPEDIRYMRVSDIQLAILLPVLEPWLSQVFRVIGGYILATGVLAVTLAAAGYGAHNRMAFPGATIAGAMTSRIRSQPGPRGHSIRPATRHTSLGAFALRPT